MLKIVSGSVELPDVEAFLATLRRLDQSAVPGAQGFFAPQIEIVVARAPGRLDVMGGIADYSGSLVLQLPLREATVVGLQRDSSRTLRILSLPVDGAGEARAFEMALADFEQDGRPLDYGRAGALFRQDPEAKWAAYVAGAFLVLMRERGIAFPEGARILVSSDVPEGKGVSSSAALEVAVLQAAVSAFQIELSAHELAILSQKVENLVVGAPCGVMDQMTAACGEANRLLALLCQPAEIQGYVAIPGEIAVWGLDSGIRHSVSGSDYTSVRVGAFMGYRVMAEVAGLRVQTGATGDVVRVDDERWRGYLANVAPSEFQSTYASRLPETSQGGTFLSRFHGITDRVTRVQPERSYAVLAPTAHPIYEHFRVRSFAELLEEKPRERRLEVLGELMFQSHASYSACGLGSEGTDRLVELVREAGAKEGLYGAKITGGGSGGTVAVLGRSGADRAVRAIAERYADAAGHEPFIFSGSSPGAAQSGVLRVSL